MYDGSFEKPDDGVKMEPSLRRADLKGRSNGPAPLGALAGWGRTLGELGYRLGKPYRVIVEHNLKFAFPSWKDRQVKEVSRRVFRNFGMTLTEMVACTRMSRNGILACCRLQGEEHFRRAMKGGRGVIIVSAHLGNWEIGLQYLAWHFGKQVHIVVRPLVPRWLDRWVNQTRARFGNSLIPKKHAFPRMLKAIREDGIVVLMVDLSTRKQSVAIDFFGHRARASPAAALLAARCNAPIIAAFTLRNPDGSFSINVSAPVAVQRSGNLKKDLRCNTQRIADIVEKAVRENPEQYLWLQKRWKDYHPYLYPGYRPRPQPLDE